jgi:hypothetical protein
VQALLSSQSTGVPEQIPVVVSQVKGLHGVFPTQGFGMNTQAATPVEVEQLSLVQALLSLQTTAFPTQVPVANEQDVGLHKSASSQRIAVLLHTPTPAEP